MCTKAKTRPRAMWMETMVVDIFKKELNQVKICRRKVGSKFRLFNVSEPARGSPRNSVGSCVVFR